MKNPLELSGPMSQCALAASDTHKKFKRKAREPRRLFHSSDTGEESCTNTLAQEGLSTSAFTHVEIPHWPTAISQPLCSRLRVGPRSSLSNNQQELPLNQTPFRPQYEEEVEHNSPSPKECQRLRPCSEAGNHGPEVKAIQQTRRLLANARERTRVHTISAAFEALRKQVPCYSYGQKLSKLAILRIACNYILSLAQLAELDYSSEQNKRSFSHCVEQCTRTLQAEGRSKKKKMERMLDNV
ncbi:transcription factor atoh8 [Boleophthalmus pectinirostris]|uniref:transcription factor atoh8 n=1 Tax=Boleophthalmus pectinirostris TaxID=150288 RepID=UPI000A1C6D04|nr:transcription factor atoh8 [Boleophthalmus pectinirostris]